LLVVAGTGVKVAIGERVTIQGLRPNDTYMVAIAVYDADGALIGECVGPPPLPVLGSCGSARGNLQHHRHTGLDTYDGKDIEDGAAAL
jgi:hypothetical protein